MLFFIEYKLKPRVTLLKTAELPLEAELFLPNIQLCCVGHVDSRELETKRSQTACVVHH